jgi:transcriptional regulator with XRE-family HTH domain
MPDISYTSWHTLSDKALAENIGAFIKHHRLNQNKTQEDVAQAAGISRSTLSLLERGETVTVSTLLQVLRVLDQLNIMDSFQVKEQISPILLAKQQHNKRKRARSKPGSEKPKSDW